jgi:hypothetical protein
LNDSNTLVYIYNEIYRGQPIMLVYFRYLRLKIDKNNIILLTKIKFKILLKTIDESWHDSPWHHNHHNTNLSVAPPQYYFNRVCFIGQTDSNVLQPSLLPYCCFSIIWINQIRWCFSIFMRLSPMRLCSQKYQYIFVNVVAHAYYRIKIVVSLTPKNSVLIVTYIHL